MTAGRGLLSQPKAVWAVAFAAVVSFMGLGLVDPILPAIAKNLHASPSQVELLFTSYFAFTGISMLVSSVVASRIGAKRTLLSGLVLIIVFSAAAGASNSVGAIVGLRAGWGLGNALFIATALSVIVGSASGGVAGAVMLYEAALGFGISLGPLLGGELGGVSWRGPFFGVAFLMAIGFVVIRVFQPRTPPPPKSERISILEPLRALRHRATRGSGLTAVFYNFGFFTLLAYTPFPLHLSIHDLGYTFTGWGLLLAIFAVFVAPRLGRRFGDVRALGGALIAIVAVLLVMGVLHASQTALIICIVGSGAFLGITNTLMTQVVMESAPVPRPIASSAYSFVRFCGGAIAPFVAGKLAEHVSVQAPFYLGAGMTAIGVVVLWSYRRALVPVDAPVAESEAPVAESPPAPAARATAAPAARATAAPAARATAAPAAGLTGAGPMVVAVGGPTARQVSALAAPMARARGAAVHVLHVIETDSLAGEDTADLEDPVDARAELEGCVAELRAAGVPVTGELLRSYGTHVDVAVQILRRAAELGAGAIVLGPETRHSALTPGVSAYVASHAPTHVVIVNPRAGALGRPVAGALDAADPIALWDGAHPVS
jgi:predicted MFS family arabinose efflux permease/nucleotide-binding universal stress UspA family protein